MIDFCRSSQKYLFSYLAQRKAIIFWRRAGKTEKIGLDIDVETEICWRNESWVKTRPHRKQKQTKYELSLQANQKTAPRRIRNPQNKSYRRKNVIKSSHIQVSLRQENKIKPDSISCRKMCLQMVVLNKKKQGKQKTMIFYKFQKWIIMHAFIFWVEVVFIHKKLLFHTFLSLSCAFFEYLAPFW